MEYLIVAYLFIGFVTALERAFLWSYSWDETPSFVWCMFTVLLWPYHWLMHPYRSAKYENERNARHRQLMAEASKKPYRSVR